MNKRIKPMLATLVDKPFDDKDWLYEIKWDGYRAVANVRGGAVDLYSRNFISFNDRYPTIVQDLQSVKEDVMLDGEIVAYDANGNVGFQALQNIGHAPAKLMYMVFDILAFQGKDLRSLPLLKRKKLLATFFKKYHKKFVHIAESEYIEEKGTAFFKAAEEKNLEGIMAKQKNSPYVSDKRTEYWLKMKHHKTDEAIIVGFTEPRGSRQKFGALVLAQYKSKDTKSNNGKKKLVFVGHTGTGFNEKSLEDLYAKMKPLITDKSPFKTKIPLNAPITWIKPKFVAQLKFAEWTSGGNMRQPVFLGLREDKKGAMVEKEETKQAETIMKKISLKGKQKKETITPAAEAVITNPDKMYFPKLGITKGDVVAYYEKIAPFILPYLKDRPETLNRHPNGIEKSNFFQKNFTNDVPTFAETTKVHSESTDEDIQFLVCNNKETLLYMANLGCIEINAWNSRKDKMDFPDYMIFDLDPGDNTLPELVSVAKMVKKVLDESCEQSYLKTSGKTGLHICVPLGAKYHFDDVRNFAELVSRVVHSRLPDITSIERSPAKRKDKIYLDYLQNRIGQTTASVYSLRPTPDAMVSTPLKWTELTKALDVKKFNIKTIHARIKKVGDLWKPVITESVDLKNSIMCLQKQVK